MATIHWTLWTRKPAQLQAELPAARYVRSDQVQPGIEVFALEIDDATTDRQFRRTTWQLLAARIIVHSSRSPMPLGSPDCAHEPDETCHHYAMDTWVVTDDRLHKVVNYFKADRCGIIEKYAEMEFLTFDDEEQTRAEVQRRVAVYDAQDAIGLN